MIRLNNLTKSFADPKTGQKKTVFHSLSFDVLEGEILAIVGPNGCGKTTLLEVLSGLQKQDAGSFTFTKNNPMVGFVFQDFSQSLFPWMTVQGNIDFARKARMKTGFTHVMGIDQILVDFGLWEYRHSYPYQLSGGQKQLVALARSFCVRPDILLLDEPFGALDYSVSRKMALQFLDVWRTTKPTTIIVSHDMDEAILLADRVLVLSERPSAQKCIVPIDLPRPRLPSMVMSEPFLNARRSIIDCFVYEN